MQGGCKDCLTSKNSRYHGVFVLFLSILLLLTVIEGIKKTKDCIDISDNKGDSDTKKAFLNPTTMLLRSDTKQTLMHKIIVVAIQTTCV